MRAIAYMLSSAKTILHDFKVKFQVISIGPTFNILYFKLTGRLTRNPNNKVGIVCRQPT